MNVYVVIRWINPTALRELSIPKYEIFVFSKKEYMDTWLRLYGKLMDQPYEVSMDDKVPEMKQLIDNLAISLQTAITVPCKTEK